MCAIVTLRSSAALSCPRMLLDGDVMLTNRQPTLHKPSLMAHK
jgi:DNA-directed RNA polymerase beta' subunit